MDIQEYSGVAMMNSLPKMIGVVAALVSSTTALAEDSGWRISETDGQVSVIRNSEAIYGEEGTPLLIGDVIRTSEAGRAVLVRGKEFAVVSPKVQIRIKRAEKGALVDQMFEFLGDLLTTGDEPTTGNRRMSALVVKGYRDGSNNNDILAAIDAKSSLAPNE